MLEADRRKAASTVEMEDGLRSWKLHGARAIVGECFGCQSSDSGAEVAGEDGSATALTPGRSYQKPSLRGAEAREERI